MIVVVAAVVEEAGRYLVTSRPAGTHLAGTWEFPGGKVGPGETHADALSREMLEELDARVQVGALVLSTTHDYPDRRVTLHFYRCSLEGRPRPLLGQEVRWVRPDELVSLELPPADAELIAVLSAQF